jgi:hypothetical protein
MEEKKGEASMSSFQSSEWKEGERRRRVKPNLSGGGKGIKSVVRVHARSQMLAYA